MSLMHGKTGSLHDSTDALSAGAEYWLNSLFLRVKRPELSTRLQ
jgi:hypothetical protein